MKLNKERFIIDNTILAFTLIVFSLIYTYIETSAKFNENITPGITNLEMFIVRLIAAALFTAASALCVSLLHERWFK